MIFDPDLKDAVPLKPSKAKRDTSPYHRKQDFAPILNLTYKRIGKVYHIFPVGEKHEMSYACPCHPVRKDHFEWGVVNVLHFKEPVHGA